MFNTEVTELKRRALEKIVQDAILLTRIVPTTVGAA